MIGGSNTGSIYNSSTTGNVTATGTYVGGLVGSLASGSISNCYATGNVSTTGYDVGGLVGRVDSGVINIYNSHAIGNVSAGNDGSSRSYAGGLIGYDAGTGTISNCYATGSVIGSGSRVGGLIGESWPTVSNCYATGNVSAGSQSGHSYAGGLIGHNNYSAISNCYATGTVTGSGDDVGGLVGLNYYSYPIYTSYATTGSVSGSSNVGGLVGYNTGTISNCYATGNVFASVDGSGNSYAGGLVGYNTTNNISYSYSTGTVSGTGKYVGGFAGFNNTSRTISGCFATGTVTGTDSGGTSIGPFIGANSGTVTNSYYSGTATNTAGSPNSLGTLESVSAKFTNNGHTHSVFTSWDFSTKWLMAGLPLLMMQNTLYITNVYQVELMNANLSGSYLLMNDIDASATTAWGWNNTKYCGLNPVGQHNTHFTGSFNGQGYTISGLYIDVSGSEMGLFGYTDNASGGSISNVGLIGGSVTVSAYSVGFLIGYNAGMSVKN